MRRRSQRYGLQVPAVIVWTDQEGCRHKVEGVTRDIAADGVFVMTPECPIANSTVRVEVRLPRSSSDGNDLRIKATGEVLRVQESGGIRGIAVHTDQKFRTMRHVESRS
jgi:PilZ domain